MALSSTVLETNVKAIFAQMADGTKTDTWMAQQLAAAITSYVATAQATTTDAGAAPAGVYAGAGTGAMAVNAATLTSKFNTTFASCNDDNVLADNTAADIGAVCGAADTIVTATTGTVTTPAGVVSAYAGAGKGKFTGVHTTIAAALKACHAAMASMSSGGDDYYAKQIASAVTTYLKAGAVSVTLQPPFISGTGAGALT